MAQKNPIYTTPIGVASYPWLTKADTKFNPEGEYRTKLRLPVEEVTDLLANIDAVAAEALETAKKDAIEKAKNKAEEKALLAKCKPAALPYKKVEDEDGNETGEIELSFKMKAIVKPKKGDPFTQKPKLFDAKGKSITGGIIIGGGSRIKVAFQMVPFFTPLVGAGATLRLLAVQVIEAICGGTADSFGFGEEEGFEYDESSAPAPEGDEKLPLGDADF